MARREFELPPGDVEFLDSQCPGWEGIRSGSANWLLVGQLVLPAGYRVATAQVALRIEPGYPDTQIDMAYFFPPLQRQDGKSIPATESTETIDGRTFQRWSRHRTAANPWRPGIDDISTHLAQVQHWLIREFPQ
jgi:hypothetical protein